MEKQKKHKLRRRDPIFIALVIAILVLLGIDGGIAGYILTHQEALPTQSPQAQAAMQKAKNDTKDEASKNDKDSKKADAKDADKDKKAAEEEEDKSTGPTSVKVMMIGDVLMHNELVESGLQEDGSYNFDFIFEHIKSYIDDADLRILNQETVMGEPERGYYWTWGAAGPIMNTPTSLADTEAKYGFNLILKAHNHTLDLGYSGLGHELDYWKANHPEIPVIGVNNPNAPEGDDSQNWVDNVYVYEKNGLKIGVINYTYATNENVDWDTDVKLVSYMSPEKIHNDVQKARDQGAEMIIACPHWGVQYTTTPSDEEYYYSKVLCDEGVDVIFGCHPHILQHVEMLQNAEGHRTVCYYSMSNFVAAGTMGTDMMMGGIAQCTMKRNADGTYEVDDVHLVPTCICYTVGPNMSAWPLSDWTYDLAAQSYRSDLTPDYVRLFCSNLFGPGFDAEKGIYTLDTKGEAREV